MTVWNMTFTAYVGLLHMMRASRRGRKKFVSGRKNFAPYTPSGSIYRKDTAQQPERLVRRLERFVDAPNIFYSIPSPIYT